ncbi:hypothetical protein [Actinomadura gamaensis]|uniref:Uncharacterized protein n=1 Tax=Actinomadura gamaensis TaxID=1763541 RepID=A0ABV9TS18_9ACTN
MADERESEAQLLEKRECFSEETDGIIGAAEVVSALLDRGMA